MRLIWYHTEQETKFTCCSNCQAQTDRPIGIEDLCFPSITFFKNVLMLSNG